MVGRAFLVKVDLDLHAITCPGVWLCPSGKVALKIHIFDSCIATHKLTPIFPLLYHNKFTFKKVFSGVTTLAELEKKLSEEYMLAELIQWSSTGNRTVCLAMFETNLVDLLYPVPCFKGLLAGVDVDLLMEPSKYFPGILSPKIEVSTKTVIEEVTDLDIHGKEAHVINPKVINSLNQRCVHKKKEPLPSKRIVRQKKVCHTGQEKLNTYLCRPCRQKKSNIEVVHNCNPSDHCLLSSKDECYLSTPKRKQICSCSTSLRGKCQEKYSICNDAHILDSCPICQKYKCYFSNKKFDSNGLSKLCNTTHHRDMCNKSADSNTKLTDGFNYASLREDCKNNECKLSSGIRSFNLDDTPKNSNYKTCNDDPCLKHSSLVRSTSVPSLKNDPTTSILLAKMKQLERTKEKLNYACPGGDSYHAPSCEDIENNDARKGFYTNLKKFYKKMYKQAKQRALDLDET